MCKFIWLVAVFAFIVLSQVTAKGYSNLKQPVSYHPTQPAHEPELNLEGYLFMVLPSCYLYSLGYPWVLPVSRIYLPGHTVVGRIHVLAWRMEESFSHNGCHPRASLGPTSDQQLPAAQLPRAPSYGSSFHHSGWENLTPSSGRSSSGFRSRHLIK